MCQVKKRDDLIHKENKLEVGGIPVHPGHMAAMQGEDKDARKVNLNLFLLQVSPWLRWVSLDTT